MPPPLVQNARHSLAASLVASVLATSFEAQSLGVQFDHGAHELIDVPYDPLVVPRTGLTVEAWVRYDEASVPAFVGHRWPTICRQNPAPGQESYVLRVGAGVDASPTLEFAVRTAAGLHLVTYYFGSGGLSSWSHVAGTYDGDFVRLFINSVEVAAHPASGLPITDAGGVLRLGNGDTSVFGAETWSGDLEEVRIWPFARSAGELAQTRNDALAGMPGGVLTFNLEGHYADSSSGLQGSPVGTPTFVPTIPIGPWTSSAGTIGTSTTTCAPQRSAIGSKPEVPNPDFTVRCVQAPPASLGFFAVGLGTTAVPLPVLGVDLYVDPAQLLVVAQIASNALGLATVNLAVDPDPGLVGVDAYTQFLFVDPTCGSTGFTASDGLVIGIQ